MNSGNIDRLMQLVEDVFAVKNDPSQLDVDENVLNRLKEIHPATVSEYSDENGPVAWLIVIPTSLDIMHQFVDSRITEKELFEKTLSEKSYDAIYLCSAIVLEEYRRQGIIKQLAVNSIKNIQKDHTIKALFSWAFSKEGDLGAEAIARMVALPLYKRTDK